MGAYQEPGVGCVEGCLDGAGLGLEALGEEVREPRVGGTEGMEPPGRNQRADHRFGGRRFIGEGLIGQKPRRGERVALPAQVRQAVPLDVHQANRAGLDKVEVLVFGASLGKDPLVGLEILDQQVAQELGPQRRRQTVEWRCGLDQRDHAVRHAGWGTGVSHATSLGVTAMTNNDRNDNNKQRQKRQRLYPQITQISQISRTERQRLLKNKTATAVSTEAQRDREERY